MPLWRYFFMSAFHCYVMLKIWFCLDLTIIFIVWLEMFWHLIFIDEACYAVFFPHSECDAVPVMNVVLKTLSWLPPSHIPVSSLPQESDVMIMVGDGGGAWKAGRAGPPLRVDICHKTQSLTLPASSVLWIVDQLYLSCRTIIQWTLVRPLCISGKTQLNTSTV